MSSGPWRRRSFLWATTGALSGAWVSRAAVTPLRTAQRVTLAVPAKTSLLNLPLTLAEQLGYFRQAGLQIEWQAHESGAKALASSVQGQAEVVAVAFEHLFDLQQKGLNYKSFVQMSRTPQVSLGIASRLELRSLLALKGLRVGITSRDSSTYWRVCQWLLQNGLQPEDVVFVEVGSSFAVVDALRSGAIDALCNPDPVMHWLEQKNEIRVLAEARSLSSTRKLLGGPAPGACLMARSDFLQRQPEVAQALSDSLVQALKWLKTAGLTDILKNVPPPYWLGDRAIYLGAFEKLRESYALDGLVTPEAVQNAWRAHHRLNSSVSTARQSLDRTFTNAFAEKSKSRFTA